jgi:uncharacterized hydrophobic protein (TIGR00271 family)
MLLLRLVAGEETAVRAVALLDSADGVRHVVRHPTSDGERQLVEAELGPRGADGVIARLEGLGVEPDELSLLHIPSVVVGRRTNGALDREALIWAEVVGGARVAARPTIRYLVYMAIAGVIAGYGVAEQSSILIVGAMAVSPDLVPLTAAAVGIVSRRTALAAGAMATLATGLAVGSLAALILTRFLRLIGSVNANAEITDNTLGWLTNVDIATVGVALAAGVAAMLAAETRASQAVGVAISVTTIPAAAFVGVATALGRLSAAGEALTVLAINVVALLVAATTTVAVQRRFVGRETGTF